MSDSLLLILDLGDVITKGMAFGQGKSHLFRFPSVVAHRLLCNGPESKHLLLDEKESLLRLENFDPRRYPRTRSYPREEASRRDIQQVPRARFAGRVAVALGADRELLGRHPTEGNIDALVHKAFFKSAEGYSRAEVVYVLDMGVKAESILRYADLSPRSARFLKWRVGDFRPRLIHLQASGRVVDAADCAVRSLPPGMGLAQVGRLLMIDIGYLRTKLAIMSNDGCEHQEEIQGLGVSDCVRRILRDGQEQGLVEDEYAVMSAMERSQDTIEVAGRRFEVGATLDRARQILEEELCRVAKRTILRECADRGRTCPAVAIYGGGAATAGQGLATRLEALDMGLKAWVATDTRYFLVDGASKLVQPAGS